MWGARKVSCKPHRLNFTPSEATAELHRKKADQAPEKAERGKSLDGAAQDSANSELC